MKKIIISLLCLFAIIFSLAGCTNGNSGENGGNQGGNNGGTTCNHSYYEGVCIHCNSADPGYKPEGEAPENPETPDTPENPDTPETPDNPPSLDGEADLPFVPAS